MFNRLLAPPLLVGLALLAGCGGGEDLDLPKRVPVSGEVRYNQQPLEGATVVFLPQDHAHGATGRTDASGRFQLQTFRPADGAVPGSYKVTIRKTENSSPAAAGGSDDDSESGGRETPPVTEQSLIPAKYGKATTSGLEQTVGEDENHFVFELQD